MATKKKLFTALPDGERKSDVILVRCTEADGKTIRNQASIRSLPTSEYVRRAALGRTANVDYETDTILALSALTKAVREMHAALVEQGKAPMEDELRPIILGARAAMLRISK